jgi:outer membrane protein TolC
MKLNPVYRICVALIGLLAITSAAVGQEPLSFRRAVELALGQSSQMALSRADEVRAYQGYLEVRDSYFPRVAVGSDVGYAYGFPLSLEGSAPTVFNVTTQSSVWSPPLRDFIRAAKADWSASKSQGSDQRAGVIMETALSYIELNRWESRVPILRAELDVAENIEHTVAERVKEGVDKGIEQTRAELVDTQVRMHMTEAEGAVDILRTRLSQLTGLPASSIRTVRDSIPALREDTTANDVASRAIQSSPVVEAAEQSAVAKQLRARGEHRALLYPSADFAAQYGLVNTSLTNFEQFFVPHSFRSNNVTFGLILRFPFLDRSQRARAAAADAEALRARKEVEEAKNKAVLDALKSQHNVEQLIAAQHVADLRYKLAENELDAVRIQMEAETATQREMQNAAVDAAERTLERIDADFQLQRSELELLRTGGELESWALSSR